MNKEGDFEILRSIPLNAIGPVVCAYPSGRWALLTVGRLIVIRIPEPYATPVLDAGPKSRFVILDPRCVIQNPRCQAIWHPRRLKPGEVLDPNMQKWLDEEPAWPSTTDDGLTTVALKRAKEVDLYAEMNLPRTMSKLHAKKKQAWLKKYAPQWQRPT